MHLQRASQRTRLGLQGQPRGAAPPHGQVHALEARLQRRSPRGHALHPRPTEASDAAWAQGRAHLAQTLATSTDIAESHRYAMLMHAVRILFINATATSFYKALRLAASNLRIGRLAWCTSVRPRHRPTRRARRISGKPPRRAPAMGDPRPADIPRPAWSLVLAFQQSLAVFWCFTSEQPAAGVFLKKNTKFLGKVRKKNAWASFC